MAVDKVFYGYWSSTACILNYCFICEHQKMPLILTVRLTMLFLNLIITQNVLFQTRGLCKDSIIDPIFYIDNNYRNNRLLLEGLHETDIFWNGINWIMESVHQENFFGSMIMPSKGCAKTIDYGLSNNSKITKDCFVFSFKFLA